MKNSLPLSRGSVYYTVQKRLYAVNGCRGEETPRALGEAIPGDAVIHDDRTE